MNWGKYQRWTIQLFQDFWIETSLWTYFPAQAQKDVPATRLEWQHCRTGGIGMEVAFWH